MPNKTPTDSLRGTFAANSSADSKPITDGKLVSKYEFGSSSKTKANLLNKVRNGVPREFDKPADRGAKLSGTDGCCSPDNGCAC